MSWWKTKLLRYGLRYGLSRTGILEDEAIDIDNLDITFGKKNVIELKDVGLNIKRISKLAQLPPSIRLETARILSLRLTVVADLYEPSIVAEVDGVEICARLEEVEELAPSKMEKQRARSPASAKTPQHRKTNRRLHSPPPYDPGGLDSSEEELRLPKVQDVAKSFLMDEPLDERKELEALAHADTDAAESESVISEMTEDDVGTGTGMGIGVPGFVAAFLQGIVDRFQLAVRNVQIKLETELQGEAGEDTPVTLRLKVDTVDLDKLEHSEAQTGTAHKKRQVRLHGISVDLLSESAAFAAASGLVSQNYRQNAASLARSGSPHLRAANSSVSDTSLRSTDLAMQPNIRSKSLPQTSPQPSPRPSPPPPFATSISVESNDSDHFADARDDANGDDDRGQDQSAPLDLEIQPGDDNISWGSRRSKASAPSDDLWNSMIGEEDLPESLMLEPERAPTPRAPSTRSNSPFATRIRRPVSPYSRGFRSPGSWPRPDRGPEHDRLQQGPGSWPTLDHGHHAPLEPLDKVLNSAYGDDESVASQPEYDFGAVDADEDRIDNKQAALEHVRPLQSSHGAIQDPSSAMEESMITSQVFSHEDAQSMYMSAMSTSPNMDIPGGWRSPTPSVMPASPEVAQLPALDEILQRAQEIGTDGIQESRVARSENVTPRAQTPEPLEKSFSISKEQLKMSVRELIHLDVLIIALPTATASPGESPLHPPTTQPHSMAKSMSPARGMPGTFSAYSEMSRSRFGSGVGSMHPEVNSTLFPPTQIPESEADPSIELSLGTVCLQVDGSIGSILYRLSKRLTTALQTQQPKASETSSRASSSGVPLTLCVNHLRARFSEALDPRQSLQNLLNSTDHGTVDVATDGLELRMSSETSFQIGSFELRLGGKDLVVFDKNGAGVANSQVLHADAPVFAVTVSNNRVSANKRPVADVTVQSAPIALSVDITTFEETFSSFGGLSGILELGNSMLADSFAEVPVSKPAKGVRFAQEPAPSNANTEIKLNGRIGGVIVSLRGSACAVVLRTSTLKAVYREAGVVATIERILLTGPYADSQNVEPPLSVDLATLRAEYLLEPQDKDLERLLSLLTPSKDKYDDDDDIIIDTLLSQRRKGAILRLQIGDVKSKVDAWEGLSTLSALGDDMSKLSAVTKYLPEDDKPGILTTLRVKEGEIRLPVNERFGQLRLALQDLHLAHVGIPALLAFSVGNLFASQVGGPQLLHPLLPLAVLDGSPVVMARMLGDEVEPTVKLKLYNLNVEYSVPVILALTGMDEQVETEVLVSELAQTVANLAVVDAPDELRHSPTSGISTASQKKTNISLLVHDSAIGLTPQSLPSRAMLVVSDAHLSTVVPPSEAISAKLELRKAAIFITDRIAAEIGDQPPPTHVSSNATTTAQRLADSLVKQGYVSVGSIMAAKIAVWAKDSDQGDGKAVEVEVRNELFLLETCADSTQTLIATLGALAPPTPPSKVPKYLTQPMQIEDMMASFTGDPLVQPEQQPETLFDVDEAPGDELESRLGISMLDDEETNDLLAESEMTASLYGPVSGVFGMDEDPDQESTTGDYGETAESLLEEDPFEMTTSPTDMYLGDAALLRELRKQCKPAIRDGPVDLGLYEIEDLGFDALGSGQQVLGDPHRFNAPYSGTRNKPKTTEQQDVPFRLHLRDFHVIWHLYDGYDWQRTRDGIVEAVEQVEIRAEERRARHRQSLQDREDDEPVIGDFLFNSIYIGVPADHDAQELRRQINRNIDEDVSETASIPVSGISRPTTQYSASGQPRQRQRGRLKLGRSKSHKIAFELKGVSADVLVMSPRSGDVVSSVDLRIKDFEIFDKVPTSTWRKFLTHQDNDPSKREMSKPMFHIQLENVKTLETHSASEIVLRVSVLPLRLHVDQDALDFITRFFEFKDPDMAPPSESGEQPFLQRVEVDTVEMCLDYKPKNVDYAGIRSGKTTEFMNFVTLEGCNIRLRHAIVYGLRGFDALHPTLNDIWMPDVKRNQLPRVLAGLAPVRSLVNLGTGMRDVVAIPVREYRKDGRVVRSIQKGAFHFGKTTASELARFGAKVALGTQTMLANAEEFLSPEAAAARKATTSRHVSTDQGWHDVASDDDEPEQRAVSAYANQPLGLFSGLKSARRYLEHDLLTAKDALIAVQGEFLESRGPGDAAAAVVKHAPTVILRPVIGATRAVGTTLLGVGNQIDRGNLRKVDDKYKRS